MDLRDLEGEGVEPVGAGVGGWGREGYGSLSLTVMFASRRELWK